MNTEQFHPVSNTLVEYHPTLCTSCRLPPPPPRPSDQLLRPGWEMSPTLKPHYLFSAYFLGCCCCFFFFFFFFFFFNAHNQLWGSHSIINNEEEEEQTKGHQKLSHKRLRTVPCTSYTYSTLLFVKFMNMIQCSEESHISLFVCNTEGLHEITLSGLIQTRFQAPPPTQ